MTTKMQMQAGFSMIELMTVVAILAVLAAVAAPSFTQLIANNRIATESNALLADLAMARNEALKRGGTSWVTVCATADGSTCSASTDWSTGRLVFVDGGTVGTVDVADTVLRSSTALTGLSAASAGFATTGYLAYSPTGAISSASQGTFTLCKSGYLGRVVTISATGRSLLANTTGVCP